MKQIKRHVFLVLCMVACLFSLTACSAAQEETETVDPMVSGILQQQAESFLGEVVSIPDDQMSLVIEQNHKNGSEAIAIGLEGYVGLQGDLDGFVSTEGGSVEKIDDGYEITVNAVFEQRACAFVITVDEEMTTITSMSFNPVYSTGEKMAKAGMNTLMGMGTVFLVLIFISLLIGCFKYIRVFEDKMKAKKAAPAKAAAPAPAPAKAPVQAAAAPAESAPAPITIPLPVAPANDEEEMEMLAILTAIIEDTRNNAVSSTDSLVVRPLKRKPGSHWKKA